ncbi:MAG TPA: polyphosphate kinase 1 [Gemmatimonadaceae bacterium]|nr:polyphosphate kinase 1 [Gemmatimonadaceae bacterium]
MTGRRVDRVDELRCDLFSADQLRRLVQAPLPLGIAASVATRTLHRDLYLDTPDGVLRRRGVSCRLRISADDRRTLTVRIAAPTPPDGNGAHAAPPLRVDAAVRAAEPRAALAEDSTVTRRLRALVDPARLDVRVELEVERWCRTALPDWLRRPRLELHYDHVTVRRDGAARTFQQLCVHRRRGTGRDDPTLRRLAEALEREHGLRPATADPCEQAELLLKWMQAADTEDAAVGWDAPLTVTATTAIPTGAAALHDGDVLDPELSLLAFQERVLALAEDDATPLGERLRFLSIVSANLDEFFSVRVSALEAALCPPPEAGAEARAAARLARQRLDAVADRVRALVARQSRCARACLAALASHGVRVVPWAALDDVQRGTLRARFRDDILPALTPLAMTLSPGHPFPQLPDLSLAIAAVLVDGRGGAPHVAEVELPADLPRFLHLPADDATLAVPVEEVVRANLDVLHPSSRVEQAYAFRVTRASTLELDEAAADDLLEAVTAAMRERAPRGAVRVEVERTMPAVLRDVVLESLRREPGAGGLPLSIRPADVYEVDGLLDLRGLDALELPRDPALTYPPLRARKPVPARTSLLDAVRAGDLLVHHPFDAFEHTTLRFLREAAADPDVTTVKITLYRVGDRSPVVEALCDAARQGKQVVAFVELRARFDEERNAGWVRALAEAGAHVVYGLVGLKTHAKAALVVRREGGEGRPGGQPRRYAHVSTGNYDARSAQRYTDLALFSAREDVTGDVAALFNALTGTSAPPERLPNGSLVAPRQLLPALLELIEREAAHARAGREARIRIKVNGLSDDEVVRALARAARDGVEVTLLVRGICTLRPDGPGGRLRVRSVVGRFLEHSRVYHFANGGDARWFIGSADLRTRNLRRRVELLVPVRDAAARAALGNLLDRYVADPHAWELTASGAYVRGGGAVAGAGVQAVLAGEGWR